MTQEVDATTADTRQLSAEDECRLQSELLKNMIEHIGSRCPDGITAIVWMKDGETGSIALLLEPSGEITWQLYATSTEEAGQLAQFVDKLPRDLRDAFDIEWQALQARRLADAPLRPQ